MTGEREPERRLVLVRHSTPAIVPGEPASRWRLSDEGRRRCTPLARRLATYGPAAIVASVEPKAAETAQLVAAHLAIPCEEAVGLHEHERDDIGWLPTREAFEAAVAGLFARPGDFVLGRETGAAARDRFARAVAATLARHPGDNLVIVAHGTVISLFVAQATDTDPFALWRRLQRLGMPSLAVLSLPDSRLETVDGIVAPDET